MTNAFFHYAKAIELAPGESSYYKNLATVVYLFRDEASRLFKTNQLGVLNRAMALYRKAFELDPGNFILAAELAQSYYGFPAVKSADAQADRRVIELRGGKRKLKSIEFWYDTQGILNGRADVTLFGLK